MGTILPEFPENKAAAVKLELICQRNDYRTKELKTKHGTPDESRTTRVDSLSVMQSSIFKVSSLERKSVE